MTEFTKLKITFALAMLGTLFALHPFLDRFDERGFVYLGVDLKVVHALGLMAALLSLCVYCYAITLLTDRPHSWFERLGNGIYALAILVGPLYGGLYLSALLADCVAVSHVAWAAPAVAAGLGIGWLGLSQVVAWRIRGRLGEQDRAEKLRQLARVEVESLRHARELVEGDYYDLGVVEAYRALESRLRRILIVHRAHDRLDTASAVIRAATRKHFLSGASLAMVEELTRHLKVAMSVEPLPRESAVASLSAVRHLLATLPAEGINPTQAVSKGK